MQNSGIASPGLREGIHGYFALVGTHVKRWEEIPAASEVGTPQTAPMSLQSTKTSPKQAKARLRTATYPVHQAVLSQEAGWSLG